MEFLSLELRGFKSFMEKAKFSFQPGITAIVGPNGCGKSNIMDALRWVLGEQSAKTLRGERMEDIIFSGTNRHKPLGMAEVSLKIKNNGTLPIDYEEVVVARRLFRSGDSEYYLNKTPCRLKDISDLFLDTGVGHKAYSLVGQGKVDFLLSSKAADRRMLIEEAAGIMKYKQRKKEALNKMQLAKQNLLRISDIIAEIKSQLDKLNKQAKAAQKYKDLLQKERELSLMLAGCEYTQLKQNWQAVEHKHQILQEEEAAQAAHVGSLDNRLEELRLVILNKREELTEFQQKVHEQELKAKRSEDRISHLRETIAHLEEQQALATKEIEQMGQEQKTLEHQLTEQQSKLKDYEKDYQGKCAQLEEEEALFRQQEEDHDQCRQKLEQEKAGMIDMAAKGARFRNMLYSLGVREREISGKLDKLGTEKMQAKNEWEAIKQKTNAQEIKLDKTKQELEKLRQQEQSLKAELERDSKILKQEEEQLGRLREDLGLKSSKLHSLRELNQTLEGFEAGVKTLMQAKKAPEADLGGLHQVIGQLIKTDARYETAIEAALSHRLGYIVADDLAQATKAILYLKQQRGGRASFILKDSMSKKEVPSKELNGSSGVIGPAIDLASYADEYAEVMKYILGDVLLVEDLAAAQKLLSKGVTGWVMASLTGEVLDPAGIVSGGGTKNGGSGILARNRRIEELQTEVTNLEAQHQKLAESVEKRLRHISFLSRTQDEKQQKLRDCELELVNQTRDAEQYHLELGRLEKQLDTIKMEEAQLKLEQEEITEETNDLKEQLNRLVAEEQSKQATIDQLKKQLAASDQKLQLLREKVMQKRVDMASLKEKKKGASVDINRLTQTIGNLAQRLNDRRSQIEKQDLRHKELKAEVAQTQAILTKLAIENKELTEACNQKTQIHQEQSTQLAQTEQQFKQQRRKLEEVQQNLNQVKLEATEAGLRLEQLADRVAQQLGLPLEQALEKIKQTEGNPELWTEQLEKLRKRLASLGDVNLTAIEEYKILEERHGFLSTQKEDLTQSIDSLHKVIASINSTTRERFKETFEAVGEKFAQVYERLFEGGKARLELEEGLSILEAGVEIMVQPPGKRLQNLSLLSGGEKALTAIAFLFAIYLIKPSPICFLDEVDAALDDVNVGRLLKMLREFTQYSQFVVITHNKKTMEVADLLYGITMENPGVSKIVSVKFKNNGQPGAGLITAKPVTLQLASPPAVLQTESGGLL